VTLCDFPISSGAERFISPDLISADEHLRAQKASEVHDQGTKSSQSRSEERLPTIAAVPAIADSHCDCSCSDCFCEPKTRFHRHGDQCCDNCCESSHRCKCLDWLTYRTHGCSCCRWQRSPCCTPPLYAYFLCLDGCVHYGPCPYCPPPGNPCSNCGKDTPAAGSNGSIPPGGKTTSNGGITNGRDPFKRDPLKTVGRGN
jgi:hypothetical protein